MKHRHFHFCNNNGIWQKPAKVDLFCISNGELNQFITNIKSLFEVDVAEELRMTRENNDQFQAELNILEKEVRTCENGIAEVKERFDDLQQEYSYYKNESDRLTQRTQIESIECSPNLSNLQLNENIEISLIRQIDDAREHDVCLGSQTIFGVITAKSCCQADELFFYDLTNFKEVSMDDKMFWVEENICFINTTDAFEIDVAITNEVIQQSCTIMAYDKTEQKFDEQIFELRINKCFENNCLFKIDSELLKNHIILNGTSIRCDESTYSGIVTKSKFSTFIKIES